MSSVISLAAGCAARANVSKMSKVKQSKHRRG
jgi:hypothetical protein